MSGSLFSSFGHYIAGSTYVAELRKNHVYCLVGLSRISKRNKNMSRESTYCLARISSSGNAGGILSTTILHLLCILHGNII